MGSKQYLKTTKRRWHVGKVASPLDEKLSQVKWGDFNIDDLFERIKTNNVTKSNSGNLPATTAILSNNQIGKYISHENATILKNVFSATANGFGKVFYQPKEFTIFQDSYAFKFKDENIKVEAIHSFIVCSLNKVFSKYNWGNKSGWNKVKKEYIKLPVKPTGEIDFQFMEEFICELDAYLSVTGLKDYTLTEEETQVLECFNKKKTAWHEFTYKNIFNNIHQGRRLKKDDHLAGDIPFVMAGVTNTGVVNYISNPVAKFPKNSITIDIFGNTFYRNYAYGAGDDTGIYWSDEKTYSKELMLFFATAMNKSLLGKFSYGKKLRSSQSLDFKMQLPKDTNIQPNYNLMETLISAVQKLVIKDVVDYADKKIEVTKKVINK